MSIYNQTLDTMVTTAIETWSKDPINALTDSGEKFLSQAARSGRVFVVNDAESIRHPVLYDHGTASALYEPDKIAGTEDAGTTLTAAAVEILTQSLYHFMAASRNINFPQSQPAGNLIDYVSAVVNANMMHILNEEEQLFVRGVAGTGAGSSARKDPFRGDDKFDAGYPMSLPSLMLSSTTVSNDGDVTTDSFAGIKTSDISKWAPHTAVSAGTSNKHDKLIEDLQLAVLNAGYSDVERPTHVYMQLDSFEALLGLLRASAALPDPVNYNIGKEGTVSFAGVTCDWSRYLAKEAMWDATTGAGSPATQYPMLGINWNSLRLNTVRAGSTDGSIGFIQQLGGINPHPEKLNLFKRIEWKRQWSQDKGRRSFFTITGLADKAIA